jgi:hypothetical protein
MNTHVARLSIATVVAALSGCSTSPSLVFGQTHTVGITMSGSASDSGAELSIGYKDRDVAVVPVAILNKEGTLDKDGMVNAKVSSERGDGYDTDSLSVLGQFTVDTDAQNRTAGLGKFFATGLAAQKLADGFSCKLSGDKCAAPSETPKPTQPAAQPASASR